MRRQPLPCGYGTKCKSKDKLVYFRVGLNRFKFWIDDFIEPGKIAPFHIPCHQEWIKDKQRKITIGLEVGIRNGLPTVMGKFERQV